MLKYERLSDEISEKIKFDRENGTKPKVGFDESTVTRRDPSRDKASIWRTAFIRDIDKIMHCPFYNRYSDKTQVFSFYKNNWCCNREQDEGLQEKILGRKIRTAPPHFSNLFHPNYSKYYFLCKKGGLFL